MAPRNNIAASVLAAEALGHAAIQAGLGDRFRQTFEMEQQILGAVQRQRQVDAQIEAAQANIALQQQAQEIQAANMAAARQLEAQRLAQQEAQFARDEAAQAARAAAEQPVRQLQAERLGMEVQEMRRALGMQAALTPEEARRAFLIERGLEPRPPREPAQPAPRPAPPTIDQLPIADLLRLWRQIQPQVDDLGRVLPLPPEMAALAPHVGAEFERRFGRAGAHAQAGQPGESAQNPLPIPVLPNGLPDVDNMVEGAWYLHPTHGPFIYQERG